MRGDRQDQQKKLSDEQLVLNAQSDKTAIGELIARYICTVEFLAKKYGAEVHEDLVQEGLMGLLGAVRTYLVHDPLQSALRKAVTAAFLCPLIRGTHIIVKCVLSSFHHATAHRPHTIRAKHDPAERLDRFLLG